MPASAEIADHGGGLAFDLARCRARRVQTLKRDGWRACTARRIFSSTRQCRKQVGDLERAADAGLRDRFRRQAGDAAPAPAGRRRRRAAYMPEIRLKAVVLPAPFGPISACKRAVAHGEARALDRFDAAEMLHHTRALRGSRRSDASAGLQEIRQRLGADAGAPAMAASSTTVLRNGASHALGDADQPASARTR